MGNTPKTRTARARRHQPAPQPKGTTGMTSMMTPQPALCATELMVTIQSCADGQMRPMLLISTPVGVLQILLEPDAAIGTGEPLARAGRRCKSGLILPNGTVLASDDMPPASPPGQIGPDAERIDDEAPTDG